MPPTIGAQLKNARLDRNLSLDDVFKNTHIRIKYLKALEADDFTAMPSPVQGRGFLRLYAQYLGLDIEKLLEEKRQTKEENIVEFTKIETPPQEEKKKEENEEDAAAPLEVEDGKTLWEQFQARVTEALAKPELAHVAEAEEEVPIPEPSPQPARPAEVAPHQTSEPTEESQIIFRTIGMVLLERREMLSLTHTEIEGHIHLRPHYLLALESGDFDSLPSPAQTRGMLSNYADFLDLDVDRLLTHYAEGLQAQRVERHIAEKEHFEGEVKKKRRFAIGGFIAPDLLFGVGIFVVVITVMIWWLSSIARDNAATAEAEATAPSIAEVLMITPTAGGTATPTATLMPDPFDQPPGATEVPIEEIFPEGGENVSLAGVRILVTIMERAWIRVTVDGEVVFEGRVQPDATFVYEGQEMVEVFTANGAGVRIAYNQRDLGLMGGFGEIVQQLYGVSGVLTPTATPTLPITNTPTPTITSTPTLAPTETPEP